MNFTSVTKETFSIQKSLTNFSIDKKVNSKELDFELLAYETYVKKPDDEKYILLQNETALTKADFLNEKVLLKQKYKIKIIPLKSNPININLSANKLKTKISATITKGSLFNSDQDIHRNLKDLIWRKKLKAGLFIDLFETFLDKQLDKLINLVPKDKPLTKDIKMTVGLGFEPIMSTNTSIQKIYKEKQNSSKSIITGVDKDELVFIYKKAKNGLNGRSCNAKYIKVKEPKESSKQPNIDDSISMKEGAESIEYFANKDGYVLEKNNDFCISNNLTLDGADYKSTGSIQTGEDKDVSVHIIHSKSENEDAIGSGVNIDVQKLSVDGSVGSNVHISTQELNIDAQTHKNSKMEVENSANIKLHRGDLSAKDAEIEMLESGKVTATNSIHIKRMLGGEASAPIVKVDELLSNCTIIASKLIEIKSIGGENINLIIDPDSIKSYHEDVAKLVQDIKDTKLDMKENKEKFEADSKEHSSQIDRIKVFQKRINQANKDGKKPMRQDMLRIKEFKRVSKNLHEIQDGLKNNDEKLNQMEEELQKLYEIDLHAQIVCASSYDGHQNVTFINPKNKTKINKHPEGRVSIISLELNADKQRVIKLS